MTDLIVIAVILLIIVCAVTYIVVQKRKGVRCIGCDAGGKCNSKQGEDCDCNKQAKQ